MRDALRRNQKQSEAIRQVDCDLMRDALRRTQTQVRGNQRRMVPWGSAPFQSEAIRIGWYLGSQLLLSQKQSVSDGTLGVSSFGNQCRMVPWGSAPFQTCAQRRTCGPPGMHAPCDGIGRPSRASGNRRRLQAPRSSAWGRARARMSLTRCTTCAAHDAVERDQCPSVCNQRAIRG